MLSTKTRLARVGEKLAARLFHRRPDPAQQEADAARNALLQELADCRRQLRCAEQQFNMAAEEALIESCVYEYRALLSRYDCLVRRAREQGIRLTQEAVVRSTCEVC